MFNLGVLIFLVGVIIWMYTVIPVIKQSLKKLSKGRLRSVMIGIGVMFVGILVMCLEIFK